MHSLAYSLAQAAERELAALEAEVADSAERCSFMREHLRAGQQQLEAAQTRVRACVVYRVSFIPAVAALR